MTIMRPLRNRDEKGLERLQLLFGSFCLRRRKQEVIHGKPILDLPPKRIRDRLVFNNFIILISYFDFIFDFIIFISYLISLY